jgi:hypothetical protein
MSKIPLRPSALYHEQGKITPSVLHHNFRSLNNLWSLTNNLWSLIISFLSTTTPSDISELSSTALRFPTSSIIEQQVYQRAYVSKQSSHSQPLIIGYSFLEKTVIQYRLSSQLFTQNLGSSFNKIQGSSIAENTGSSFVENQESSFAEIKESSFAETTESSFAGNEESSFAGTKGSSFAGTKGSSVALYSHSAKLSSSADTAISSHNEADYPDSAHAGASICCDAGGARYSYSAVISSSAGTAISSHNEADYPDSAHAGSSICCDAGGARNSQRTLMETDRMEILNVTLPRLEARLAWTKNEALTVAAQGTMNITGRLELFH